MLELKGISKEYQVDKESVVALKDVNLTFSKVQFASILGPSGCGKTTLLNMLSLLDKPSSGEVIFNGVDISKCQDKVKDSFRNSHIGFVFQNCYLVDQLNALENVMLPLSLQAMKDEERRKRALEALKRVGGVELQRKKPNQLSGGQLQRVAIARALVTNPSYILCDEPTGALDSKSAKAIMDILKELAKDHLVIVVTHNEENALFYSDRIIRMKDGMIQEDTERERGGEIENKEEISFKHLSFKSRFQLAIRNLFKRKSKTILNAVASSFALIAIGFVLAINRGFDSYALEISQKTASSLPVVVLSYNQTVDKEAYAEVNSSILYPEASEVYPEVSTNSTYSYSYNNISSKYIALLDSLVDEGIVREYILSYSNSYSFNLCTDFPKSLDGTLEGEIAEVDTTILNSNYYASSSSLPVNIFHVLYGDMQQYDLLAGSLPQSENDLVLVLDEYNSVSFEILQALGFYSKGDEQEDVKLKDSVNKVKSIAFSDIIGKEYKIFTNDEFFISGDTIKVTDMLKNEREVTKFTKRELTEDFYSKGKTLKISGIIRPKSTSSYSLLSPALCYTPSLQTELTRANQTSEIASKAKNNVILYNEEGSASLFIEEIKSILTEYQQSENANIPTSELNELFNRYFRYYSFFGNSIYSGLTAFLNQSKIYNIELIDDEIKRMDFTDVEQLNELYYELMSLLNEPTEENTDRLYSLLLSLASYANAYSTLQCLVIFPTDLKQRDVLLERLDEYNDFESSSTYHASNQNEVIQYVQVEANRMVEDVGEMISLVTVILLIFAFVSLVVSISMTALMILNNVLERKKEIGLMRSLGIPKRDILSLFEIESSLVSLVSSLLGSLCTYILTFPINALLDYYYPGYSAGSICDFTIYHALILILLALVIGFFSALMPSYKASKVEPVVSLRSD